METVELILAGCAGLGLAASCGFRIFVPPLVMGVAVLNGHFSVSDEFAWLGTYPAIVILGMATVAEIGAYYVPWLDNMLDSIATPMAGLAGIAVSAAAFGDVDPVFKWSMAVIAGGGGASLIQAGTVALRAASSLTTGGLGNPVVSSGEGAAATGISMMAIFLPIIGLVLLVLVLYFGFRHMRGRRRLPTTVKVDSSPDPEKERGSI